jgi:hypothetical protein
MKYYTCTTQKELLFSLFWTIDIDRYQILVSNTIPINEGKLEHFKQSFDQFNLDELYSTWHKILKVLPMITNKKLFKEFLDEMRYYVEEVELRIENRKVIYNDILFRELDKIYNDQMGISVYDKIKYQYLRFVNLMSFIKGQIEKRMDELEYELPINGYKPIGLKFSGKQTKTIAYFFLAENLGLFYDPENQKPINRIFDGALFNVGGELKQPADIAAIMSRIRKGKDDRTQRTNDRKIKKELILAAKQLIEDLENNEASIYQD